MKCGAGIILKAKYISRKGAKGRRRKEIQRFSNVNWLKDVTVCYYTDKFSVAPKFGTTEKE